ncbi:hypothetical protein [Moraxella lacunata]
MMTPDGVSSLLSPIKSVSKVSSETCSSLWGFLESVMIFLFHQIHVIA